ncbi:cellulase family glycosylhydrolase [Actinomadura sp. 6K520]|uniref:cellulase family glycosylhydrolase n=1 Tax=Actinomadura sp. 6K520 TaxID=2530364 RepID=UPI001044C517|nr:cellulase family glycosylhydrolase [Actinomadura sp. 6K520]TDE37222.1 endoglycosylceramidase [Actinomadura sp. 6K520]
MPAFRASRVPVRLLSAVLLAVAGLPAVTATPAAAMDPPGAIVVAPDDGAWEFRDGEGREVTLRGFNVSGSTKLYENDLLPFRTTADAARSAQAMRDLTGANAIRFLISWEGVQPAPDRIDHAYLDRVAAQIREFTDRGIRVLLDYHQDLYSSHLFHEGSWYTGDGAPEWVIEAGDYPRESCGICLLWGQNMMNNGAVRQAAHDFWRNRVLATEAGPIGVQDAFLAQAKATMTHLERELPRPAFDAIIGFDPFNEPFDGGLDGGSGLDWEKNHLMPFYHRFRAAMDEAGWAAKPAFVEPLVFWNTGFFEQGGMTSVGRLGTRMVFNTHYYDGARMTLDPSPASDGTYAAPMNEIRRRAAELGTAPIVSEFGNKLDDGRTPWMVRGMYQAMDYGVPGRGWWNGPSGGGAVLSALQWHWDVYSGRHHELMNGNPRKVQTEGDAWNDEDHSVVTADDAGTVTLRLDQRVLDRLYPAAVNGDTLAFAFEDLARSGYGGTGRQQPWLTVPSSMPGVAALVEGRQYGVLVWRGSATGAPTDLHLPRSFAPGGTTVVSDLGALTGVPASGPVKATPEPGSSSAHRLQLTPAGDSPAAVHFALVANTTTGTPVTPAQLAAARAELSAWANRHFAAG